MKKQIKIILICILLISSTIPFLGYISKTVDNNDKYYLDENYPIKNITIGIGNTYYVSTTGDDNNPGTQSKPFGTIQKAMNIVNPGDMVYVRGGIYNEQCTMTRCGTSDAWIIIKNYPGEIPIIDGIGIDLLWGEGLVQLGEPAWSDWSPLPTRGFWGVEYVIFDGFTVNHSDGYGILLSMSRYIYLLNCEVYNSKDPGIEANNGHEFPPYGSWDPMPHPHHLYIHYCHVGEGCNWGGGGEGISVVRCDYTEVKYCSVIDNFKQGIDFKNGCTYGTIAYNDISPHESFSGSCIYVDSQGDTQHDFWIYNNYCHGYGGNIGIGNENGGGIAKNFYIYNNIFISKGHGFYGIESGWRENIQIINNIFDVGWWAFALWVEEAGIYHDLVIRNNIIYGGKGGIRTSGGFQPSYEMTIDHNFFMCYSEHYGNNYLTGDPKFVNRAEHDYHLQPNSPCIDAGYNAEFPSEDYDGIKRPQGNSIDIGAFEYFDPTTINNPPSKPIINGESIGKPGIEYQYSFISTDPEEDEISYYIDWDDNTPNSWTRTLPSGIYYNTSHSWNEIGSFSIKAKAKDKYGAESDWAVLEVKIPKRLNQQIELLLKILQRFPELEKIIKLIL